MNRLQQLFTEQGQSPWLDNLRRDWFLNGELERWVDQGVRGLTSNPAIFTKAILGSDAYDEQFWNTLNAGLSVEDAYWVMVTDDILAAIKILRPVYDQSAGLDGYVSVEVDPKLARDTQRTTQAARALHQEIDAPNLYVKIPATREGLPSIQTMIAEHRSINVTLIFSLQRYAEVMNAYIAGLETATGDLSDISSVASFFISRLDSEVDKRLDRLGSPAAQALKGKAAIACGQIAYEMFLETFSGPRWQALAARGARAQRPLWASTSTKDPAYPATMYVDNLIGPNTVNTLPDSTAEAFARQGVVTRTIDDDLPSAHAVLDQLANLGIDLDDVTNQLEIEGLAAFENSFVELLDALETKVIKAKGCNRDHS
ncbi:MAG: transaldolase [Acidimicrobiia bacterium]|nr:transaldolase [Acidimicrobiia bacterium]MCY4456438.1 transaldolase [Acidimicrobiaceae bacterium]